MKWILLLSFSSLVIAKGGVQVLNGDNFGQIVDDRQQNVCVKFYAPNCPHCISFAPVYESTANEFARNDKINFGKVDLSDAQNSGLATRFGISHVPSVLFFPMGADKPVPFQGSRTVEDLTAFCLVRISKSKAGRRRRGEKSAITHKQTTIDESLAAPSELIFEASKLLKRALEDLPASLPSLSEMGEVLEALPSNLSKSFLNFVTLWMRLGNDFVCDSYRYVDRRKRHPVVDKSFSEKSMLIENFAKGLGIDLSYLHDGGFAEKSCCSCNEQGEVSQEKSALGDDYYDLIRNFVSSEYGKEEGETFQASDFLSALKGAGEKLIQKLAVNEEESKSESAIKSESSDLSNEEDEEKPVVESPVDISQASVSTWVKPEAAESLPVAKATDTTAEKQEEQEQEEEIVEDFEGFLSNLKEIGEYVASSVFGAPVKGESDSESEGEDQDGAAAPSASSSDSEETSPDSESESDRSPRAVNNDSRYIIMDVLGKIPKIASSTLSAINGVMGSDRRFRTQQPIVVYDFAKSGMSENCQESCQDSQLSNVNGWVFGGNSVVGKQQQSPQNSGFGLLNTFIKDQETLETLNTVASFGSFFKEDIEKFVTSVPSRACNQLIAVAQPTLEQAKQKIIPKIEEARDYEIFSGCKVRDAERLAIQGVKSLGSASSTLLSGLKQGTSWALNQYWGQPESQVKEC